MAVSESLGALLAGAIDYAGLFPPANLAMNDAVARYAAARRGPQGWLLGRFVVPAARLEEFAGARAAIKRGAGGAWPLSVLLAGVGDGARARDFGQRQPALAQVAALETKAASAAEIAALARTLPSEIERYVELPPGADLARCLAALRAVGLRAKLRTGGVAAEAVPSVAAVARFLVACAGAAVAFKATAGLHHGWRGAHPLSYERGAAQAVMHGFLNVMLAACCARQGWPAARLEALLADTSASDFRFEAGGAAWRDERLATEEIARARRAFVVGFGSCSFDEPVADLASQGWL